MSIRKRVLPSGRTAGICDYRDGGGARRYKQFKTRKEAEAFRNKTGVDVQAGVHTPDRTSITVAEAGKRWLEQCELRGLEDGTQRFYRSHLQHHILPRLGRLRLTKLTKPLIVNLRNQLLAEHSQSLTAQVMTSLKGLIATAQEDGLISQNVALGIKVRKSARHEERVKIPEKHEIRAIIKAARELWPATSPWPRFITVALFTGCRPSEIRALLWKSVSFERRIVEIARRADYRNEVGSPKSKAGRRTVPLAPMALAALREWRLACRKTEPDDLVFPAEHGGVIAQSTMTGNWKRLLAAAGLKPKAYRLYDLRHAAISLMIEEGWTVKKVQVVAGHSKASTTLDVYSHLWRNDEYDAAAMAKVEERLLRDL